MYTQFQCGRCGNTAQAMPGTTVACPTCGTHVFVPGAGQQQGSGWQQQPAQHQQQSWQQQPAQQQQSWQQSSRPHPPPQQAAWQQQPAHQQQQYHGGQGGFWYSPPSQPAKQQEKAWQDQQRAEWTAPLLMSCCHQPLWCMCGYCCLPCTVFMQRRKLLMADKDENNWQYYHCCAGIWGPSLTGHCDKCTDGNGCVCAACESCCCAGCAMHGNRYMVMLHYGLENTCCDIFLFWLSCICSVLACLTGSDELELIADILYYMLMGCMAAQHENEMDKRGYPQGMH
eukprot:TRINITY_DN1422_c0_g1_i4.p1 TRINITY_DN1422_c0_g1~~TRINITY_DN1422_c0_g1_i4.p1  ORF type:complete len:284 (+),score=80.41 TRINITY_DN1422_c0_g1_i4:84-935(+)